MDVRRRELRGVTGVRGGLGIGLLLTVAAWTAGLLPGAGAAATSCGSSPPGNGSGYQPPQNRASLPPSDTGPEILHRPLATSPQLENTGPWRAAPIMVSGSRSYRQGELVYQDFLYDDRALTYPDEPKRYAGNAADLVEVRLKPLADRLAVRLTYNSMLDPDAVAATVVLGDSPTARPLPHDAGAVSRGELFVTVHGCSGDLVRAADGTRLRERLVVRTDLRRRQVHVEVPYTAFDPRGRRDVAVRAAAGLWDGAAGRYRRPDPARPAFFNVAFRGYGPWTQATFHDGSQNAALAAGDLSPIAARVDFVKLAAGVRDDLTGQPGGVPRHGPMNRIHVSHVEPAQGRGTGPAEREFVCEPPDCTPDHSSRLQPYAAYVPDGPPPREGYGLVVSMHGAGGNQNHVEGGPPGPYAAAPSPVGDVRRPGQQELDTWRMLAQAGRPSIMILPDARGPAMFYTGLAAADVFEAWADVAGRYRLDPTSTVLTGTSMGGYGTYKLGAQYPDLFNALMPNVAPGGPVIFHVPGVVTPVIANDDVRRGETAPMLASLRHVPVLATLAVNDPLVPLTTTTHSMRTLHELGYRYDFWSFAGPYSFGHAEYRHYVRDAYAALHRQVPRVVRDPRRVTYVVIGALTTAERRWGLDSDHAYWVRGLAARDGAALGQVDVVSHGLLDAESVPGTPQVAVGTAPVDLLPYSRTTLGWTSTEPATARRNALTLTVRNVRDMTVDVDRARVGCDAALSIDSDGPVRVTLQGRACTRTVTAPGPSAP